MGVKCNGCLYWIVDFVEQATVHPTVRARLKAMLTQISPIERTRAISESMK